MSSVRNAGKSGTWGARSYLIFLLLLLFNGLLTTAGVSPGSASQPPESQYPFQNPNLPIEDRIKNILSLMTLDEKIAALGTNPSVPRLGIKARAYRV